MRAALRTVVVFVSSLVLFPAGAHAQANPEKPVGFEIEWNHVALSVPNLAESIAWYEKMLGFKGTVRGGGQPGGRQQVADLRRGNITIELFQVADAAPLPESRKNPSEDFRTPLAFNSASTAARFFTSKPKCFTPCVRKSSDGFFLDSGSGAASATWNSSIVMLPRRRSATC